MVDYVPLITRAEFGKRYVNYLTCRRNVSTFFQCETVVRHVKTKRNRSTSEGEKHIERSWQLIPIRLLLLARIASNCYKYHPFATE